MSKIEIRKLSVEEAAPVFSWLTGYAFFKSPPIHRTPETFIERFAHTEGSTTYLALFEDNQAAVSAGAGPMIQNVRGKLVDSAGIFMVATNPAQRRKGYAFQLLKELFKQIRKEGFGFSTLYPFRESFYERLGFTHWPPPFNAEINIRSLAPLLDQDFSAEVELMEFVNEPDQYFDFLKQYQQKTHGMATFVKTSPPDPKLHKAWQLISRVNGEVDGIMLYDLTGDTPTQFNFNVRRFYYLSPASRYQFLKWIANHIDQTSKVSMVLPVFEQPQTWLSDLDVKISTHRLNPMGRVVNIEKLNGIPAGIGQFNVEITDPTCPWNEGNWQFGSNGGELSVTPASKADFTLGIQGISSLVFGNLAPENFQYRGWGEVPTEDQHQMNSLFPPATPHLHEYF